MTNLIRKAVFPVGGLGTRFLPATKANPKEMLPVVDKPLIQYAAEEAVEAGCDTLIFITGRNKRSIPDHFDLAYELESELEADNKDKMLATVRNIVPPHVACVYIRQSKALGLGHAVSCAQPVVGSDPFAVILADDLIQNDGPSCMQQMTELYQSRRSGIIGVQQVPEDETHRYGVIDGEQEDERLWDVKRLVEKPSPAEAPSNVAIVGRYILTASIFEHLQRTDADKSGEIQLTDAIQAQLQEENVLAYRFVGKRYDCGDKLGYLQATVEYGLRHPELHEGFRAYLSGLNPESIKPS